MNDFPDLSEEEASLFVHQTFTQTPQGLLDFKTLILDFYAQHGRPFAWRRTSDPYQVLVSEVMLQQTQTGRVVPKYESFLSQWPDFPSLAEASTESLLSVWKGLGYNRRALNLRKSARMTEAWDWTIPNDKVLIESLPGVGKATSAAIRSFCFGQKSVYLETNIRRVLLSTFYPEVEEVKDKDLELLLYELSLINEDMKSWYYALMDYGVLLKALFPNANRRSAHYTKQKKFENSNRQIRGQLIHLLTDTGSKELSVIYDLLPYFEDERILNSLEQLTKEGFVQEKEGVYGLREE
ncbi:MAG: DNA repair protein [Spirochaetia bacterium]|nr:DNA repair protein [Spirochaetia bacterium]